MAPQAETIGELARLVHTKPVLAPVNFDEICLRLGLQAVAQSRHMFGGDCPICGGKRSFYVWLDSKPIRVVCYECKINLSIHRNVQLNGPPLARVGA